MVASEIFQDYYLEDALGNSRAWIIENKDKIIIFDFITNRDFENSEWMITIYYIVKG
jgi:hypothetical protein